MTKEKVITIKLSFKLTRHSEINVFDSLQLQNKGEKFSHFIYIENAFGDPLVFSLIKVN